MAASREDLEEAVADIGHLYQEVEITQALLSSFMETGATIPYSSIFFFFQRLFASRCTGF